MWSDIIQHAERLHYLRLSFWGAFSVVAGTALLAFALVKGHGSAMIRRFAWVCLVLGGAEVTVGASSYRSVGLRDLSAATRLDRLAWLQVGLYLGMAAVGATISVVASSVARKAGTSNEVTLPSVGGGIGIALHGLALATLELLLVAAISR